MKKILVPFIFLNFFFGFIHSQNNTEIRAVWLTTNYALDWPKHPVKGSGDNRLQKKELCAILDTLENNHFNMVFLQVRLRGTVIYPSEIERWCDFFNSSGGSPGYDPLAFAIDECHKRGLECHAWFVTYPLGPKRGKYIARESRFIRSHPSMVKIFRGDRYLDPGNPATTDYLLSLIKEIVSRYDIDGFHFDYIRYPDKSADFPDGDTYSFYGRGSNLEDWRRNNINRFVYAAYDEIKKLKPWVQVSSSTLGMYKKIRGNTQAHWCAYYSVYQDPVDWISKGKHDFIVPMMYYRGDLFYPFVKDWVERCKTRFVVPGLALYRMEPYESDWAANEIENQVAYSRSNGTYGNSFYRTAQLMDNEKTIRSDLEKLFYGYPAKLPPLKWLSAAIPARPLSLEGVKEGGNLKLTWEKNPQNFCDITYNLYRSPKYVQNVGDSASLVSVYRRGTSFYLPIDETKESGYYYWITASDRYHEESPASQPVYFCTGNFEK